MTRNKRNGNKKKKQQPGQQRSQTARTTPMGRMPGRGTMGPLGNDYMKLLSDPCNAKLVPAVYAGMGSSLLVRTTDYYKFPSDGSGVAANQNFIFEFTPWNYPTCVQAGTNGTNSVTISQQTPFLTNFVTASTVRAYRPIACCVKWIPTGPTSGRSGVIGMAYNPSRTQTAGPVTVTATLPLCNKVDSNGSTQHEILWLPSFGDERFGANGEVNITGAGSVLVVGEDVDGYDGLANGLIECTVVWEWIPESGRSISSSVAAPAATTLQQVLSAIKDVNSFVTKGARAVTMGYNLISRYSEQRGNSFLLH